MWMKSPLSVLEDFFLDTLPRLWRKNEPWFVVERPDDQECLILLPHHQPTLVNDEVPGFTQPVESPMTEVKSSIAPCNEMHGYEDDRPLWKRFTSILGEYISGERRKSKDQITIVVGGEELDAEVVLKRPDRWWVKYHLPGERAPRYKWHSPTEADRKN